MAKKKSTARKYITARYKDGRGAWQFSVPFYIGRVKVGETVVVCDPRDGDLAFAEVVSIDPCAVHRRENIWPIVERVRLSKWRKLLQQLTVKVELLRDMGTRQAELDALSRYADSAEHDEEMKGMLADYKKVA